VFESVSGGHLTTHCLGKRVRVDEHAARSVHNYGVFLHLAQKLRVDDVSSLPGSSTKSTLLPRVSLYGSTHWTERRLWRSASDVPTL
jgi:hypothetical protein